LISILDANIVISPADIKLGEPNFSVELLDKFLYKRKGVGVSDGEVVKTSIVHDGTVLSVFLLGKEEGGCIGGFRDANVTFLEVFSKEFVEFLLVYMGERKGFAIKGCRSVRNEVYSMVPDSRLWKALGFFVTEDFSKGMVLDGDLLLPCAFGGVCSFCSDFCGFSEASDEGVVFWFDVNHMKGVIGAFIVSVTRIRDVYFPEWLVDLAVLPRRPLVCIHSGGIDSIFELSGAPIYIWVGSCQKWHAKEHVIVTKRHDVKGVCGSDAIVLNIEICGGGDLSNLVPGSINISDGSRFREDTNRDIEVIDEVRGNEAFCGSAVNEGTDFGVEGSRMEFNESMDGFLSRNEDSLRVEGS
jgi:hypothetical protein